MLSKTEFLNTCAVIKFKVLNTTDVTGEIINRSLEDVYTVMYYDEVDKVYVEVPCEYHSVKDGISVLTRYFLL